MADIDAVTEQIEAVLAAATQRRVGKVNDCA